VRAIRLSATPPDLRSGPAVIASTSPMIYTYNMKRDDNERPLWPLLFMLGYAFFLPVILAMELCGSLRANCVWDYFRRTFGPRVPRIFNPADWCYGQPRISIAFGFAATPLNMLVTGAQRITRSPVRRRLTCRQQS
jgi:hypothetical protein